MAAWDFKSSFPWLTKYTSLRSLIKYIDHAALIVYTVYNNVCTGEAPQTSPAHVRLLGRWFSYALISSLASTSSLSLVSLLPLFQIQCQGLYFLDFLVISSQAWEHFLCSARASAFSPASVCFQWSCWSHRSRFHSELLRTRASIAL